jgi:hypothetical protein
VSFEMGRDSKRKPRVIKSEIAIEGNGERM